MNQVKQAHKTLKSIKKQERFLWQEQQERIYFRVSTNTIKSVIGIQAGIS